MKDLCKVVVLGLLLACPVYAERVAAFTFSPPNPTPGQTVTFDASMSICSAQPCSYHWTDDTDNSGLGAGVGMSFVFQQPGPKLVHLTITDALSRTASVEHEVMVTLSSSPTPPPPDSNPPPQPPAPPSVKAPSITSFTPTSGGVGSSVTINGTNFTGATVVRFNGVNSSYVVNSSSSIQAKVPTGATTGALSVITPGGTANSSVFNVNSTSAGSGITYYVSSAGSDANIGKLDSSPWKTIAKVESFLSNLHPGDSVLFKCGDAWNEQLDLNNAHGVAGNPITIGHYGNSCKLPHQTYTATLPVINGGSTRQHGIYSTGGISYITIDGFDVHDTTMGGIEIRTSSPEPGIVIQNNLVHQVGAGACSGCGSPHDDGSYNAGLGFRDFSGGNGQDGIQILNNTVWDTGGHNTLGVHYDASPNMRVSGNLVGPGCIHNCIDTKGASGIISNNITTCSSGRGEQCGSGNAGYYIENTYAPSASVTYRNNVSYSIGIGFQASAGGSCSSKSGGNCKITAKYYNNTVYKASFYSFYYGSGRSIDTLDIRNNIFHGAQFRTGGSLTENHNDCYGGASCTGASDMSVDPQYVNPNGNDFHLQSNSLVIGKGINVGSGLDLGAFQR